MNKKLLGMLGIFTVFTMLLMFVHHGNYWSWHWYFKWTLLLIMSVLFFSYQIGAKLSWYLAPIFGWCLLSAIWVGAYSNNVYLFEADTTTFVMLGKNALYAAVVVLLAGQFLMGFKKEWAVGVRLSLFMVALLSVCGTLLLPKGMGANDGIFSGNPSMNGCLMAALMPFLLELRRKKKWWDALVILATLTAIWRTHTNIGLATFFGVLFVYYGAQYISRKSWNTEVLFYSGAGLMLAFAAFAQLTLGKKFGDDDGRFPMWDLAMRWWGGHANQFTGTGLGTAQILLPVLQTVNKQTGSGLFLWMHSDWYQTLFELGFVGVILALIAWAYLAYRAWGRPDLLASFLGFSAYAVFNYPLRLPIHTVSILFIVVLILKEKGARPSVAASL